MSVREKVLHALIESKEFISGDNELSPYLSGPQIIKLFNNVGIKEMYNRTEGGMPRHESRNEYTFIRTWTDLSKLKIT